MALDDTRLQCNILIDEIEHFESIAAPTHPICTMPGDLLLEIFQILIEDDGQMFFTLMAVCKEWERYIRQTSLFWKSWKVPFPKEKQEVVYSYIKADEGAGIWCLRIESTCPFTSIQYFLPFLGSVTHLTIVGFHVTIQEYSITISYITQEDQVGPSQNNIPFPHRLRHLELLAGSLAVDSYDFLRHQPSLVRLIMLPEVLPNFRTPAVVTAPLDEVELCLMELKMLVITSDTYEPLVHRLVAPGLAYFKLSLGPDPPATIPNLLYRFEALEELIVTPQASKLITGLYLPNTNPFKYLKNLEWSIPKLRDWTSLHEMLSVADGLESLTVTLFQGPNVNFLVNALSHLHDLKKLILFFPNDLGLEIPDLPSWAPIGCIKLRSLSELSIFPLSSPSSLRLLKSLEVPVIEIIHFSAHFQADAKGRDTKAVFHFLDRNYPDHLQDLILEFPAPYLPISPPCLHTLAAELSPGWKFPFDSAPQLKFFHGLPDREDRTTFPVDIVQSAVHPFQSLTHLYLVGRLASQRLILNGLESFIVGLSALISISLPATTLDSLPYIDLLAETLRDTDHCPKLQHISTFDYPTWSTLLTFIQQRNLQALLDDSKPQTLKSIAFLAAPCREFVDRLKAALTGRFSIPPLLVGGWPDRPISVGRIYELEASWNSSAEFLSLECHSCFASGHSKSCRWLAGRVRRRKIQTFDGFCERHLMSPDNLCIITAFT